MANDNLPSIAPRNYEEARAFAVVLSKSNFCPKDYRDKPDEIMVAVQMGNQVGLGYMQSVQNIAVINGRPCLWGDAMLALVQASGLLKFHKEYFDKDETAVCEVARKGDVDENGKQVVHVVKFSNADRDKAGLSGKGVHNSYPKRMKQMRARGFALRDKFADVLGGLIAREEALDITDMQAKRPDPLPEDNIPDLDETPQQEVKPSETVEVVMDTPDGLQRNPRSASSTLTPAEVKEAIALGKRSDIPIEAFAEMLREEPFNLTGEFPDLTEVKRAHFDILKKRLEGKE